MAEAPTMVVLQFGSNKDAHEFFDHWVEEANKEDRRWPSGKVIQFVTFTQDPATGEAVQVEELEKMRGDAEPDEN